MALPIVGKIGVDALIASGALATLASQFDADVLEDALAKIGLVADAAGEFVIREGTPVAEAIYNAGIKGADLTGEIVGTIAGGLLSTSRAGIGPDYTTPTDAIAESIRTGAPVAESTFAPSFKLNPMVRPEEIQSSDILSGLIASQLKAGEEGPLNEDEVNSSDFEEVPIMKLPPSRDPKDSLKKVIAAIKNHKKKIAWTAGNLRQAFTEEGVEGVSDAGAILNYGIVGPAAGGMKLLGDLAELVPSIGGLLPEGAVTDWLFGNMTGPIEVEVDKKPAPEGFEWVNGKLVEIGSKPETSQKVTTSQENENKEDIQPRFELSENIKNIVDESFLNGLYRNQKLDSLISNVKGVREYLINTHGMPK